MKKEELGLDYALITLVIIFIIGVVAQALLKICSTFWL